MYYTTHMKGDSRFPTVLEVVLLLAVVAVGYRC